MLPFVSSATQLELTVAEGLLDALDTPRGLEMARQLFQIDLTEAEARVALEEMLKPKCESCGERKVAGKACEHCGLAEAESVSDLLAQGRTTDIGQDMNFPQRVDRKKKKRRRKKKVEEATNVGGTAAVPSSGTATPWGGAPYAGAADGVVRVPGKRDADFQGRAGGQGFTDSVVVQGDVLTTPPNLRDATGWERCGNCVFFGNGMCNLYGWDRDGTPAGADAVHRGGTLVDDDDLCDAHSTLTPRMSRLMEALDREDFRLAEAARAANPMMIVRARARVARAEELLNEAVDLEEFGGWSDEARAAALVSRRAHGGGGGARKMDKFGSQILQRAPKESALHYVMRRMQDKAPAAGKSQQESNDFYKAKLGANHKLVHLHEARAEFLEEIKSDAYPGLDRSPKKNWVDKAGGLPRYIERIAKHLHYEKGKDIGQAIAIAVNVVKKMCGSGDTNFPGKQNVNAKSRAQACAAVAQWEAKKAKSKTKTALEHGDPWESFPVALALMEAEYRPIPPSDRFIENLLQELAQASGPAWYEGMAELDEAEGLIVKYGSHLDEVRVGLDESNIVALFDRAGKTLAGHWDPMKHPRVVKGRKGGGEFQGTNRVLAGIERKARGSVGGRDKQRGYSHPGDAPMHERMVAEMFDRAGRDHSIFPAERKALGSYLRRKGAVDLAGKLEAGRSRMLSPEDAAAIERAVRGDGNQVKQTSRARMPQLGGKAITHDHPAAGKVGYVGSEKNDKLLRTVAHDATSTEDAFKHDNAAHGRKNQGDMTVDQAISSVLENFKGLKDWSVEKKGEDYHVSVEMPDKKHLLKVDAKGSITDITAADKKHGASKAEALPKYAPGYTPEAAAYEESTKSKAVSVHDLEPTGVSEKPYHMPDGAFYMGHDGVLYQKMESGPKLMMGKKGPLAAVRIHNHKTGTEKLAPAFALSQYYDLYAPKGGGSHAKQPDPSPSHEDLESQLKASIAGQAVKPMPAFIVDYAAKAVASEKATKETAYAKIDAEHGFDIAGKHFVITGEIPGMTRKEAELKLKAKGGYPHSSVSGKVDLLITGAKGAGGANKVAAAKSKNIPIKDYPEVAHLFEAELDPTTVARLRQLERVEEHLMEATGSTDIVRLRARRRTLLNGLGLEEREFSTAQRKKAASKGNALDDGSFPIENTSDLSNAIKAVGRAAPGKRAKVRAHIRKHAKRLGAESSLPEGW